MKNFSTFLSEEAEYFHGSPHHFDKFKGGNDIFLSHDKHEAKRYGPHVYRVKINGKPKFSIGSVVVVKHDQIDSMEHIEHNPNQKIYRT